MTVLLTELVLLLQDLSLPPTDDVTRVLAWVVATLASAVAALFYGLLKAKEQQIADLTKSRDALMAQSSKRTDQLFELSSSMNATMVNLETVIREAIKQRKAQE